MGQTQYQHTHPVLDNNWVTVQDNPNIFSHVNPHAIRTLRNTTNNQEVEEYIVEFASEYDFRRYAEELRMRMEPSNNHIIQQNSPDSYYNLSPYIYTVKYFVNNTLNDMCSTIYKGLLYAQKVDLRLKEINDIPLSDQLYLTKATLQGFKLLYERVGYFDITEEMIFINKEGRVKVWINSNLSKNEPLYIPNFASRDAHGSQSDMLVQLLDLIAQNSDEQEHQTLHFKEYLNKKGIYNRLSFYRALDEFQAYCMEEHLTVENCMKSIYELYHQDQPEHSDVMQLSADRGNSQHTAIRRQSEYKLRNGVSPANQTQFAQLHLPIRQMDNGPMAGSRVSKHSQRNSKYNFQSEKQEETHRARSTNNGYAQKIQELSFNTSNVPTFHNYESPQTIHQNFSLHPSNLPVLKRGGSPSQQALGYGLPPLQRRSQHILVNENSKPAVIKFNYGPHQNLANSRNSQQLPAPKENNTYVMPPHLETVQSIQTQSRSSTRQMNHFSGYQSRGKTNANSINYYSSDRTYTLDREIAEDLQKFLGYSLNT